MTFFTLGKVMLVLLYVAALMIALFPSLALGEGMLVRIALITLVIHVIELAFVDRRLRHQANPAWHRLQVLLFGYFHWGKLDRAADRSA